MKVPLLVNKPRPPQIIAFEGGDTKPVKVEVDSFGTVKFGKVRVWIGQTRIGDYAENEFFDLLPEGRIYAVEGLENNTMLVVKETPRIIT